VAPCFGFKGDERKWENMIGACGLSGYLVLLVEWSGNGVDGKIRKCPRTEKDKIT
jgi:hypothetical protein